MKTQKTLNELMIVKYELLIKETQDEILLAQDAIQEEELEQAVFEYQDKIKNLRNQFLINLFGGSYEQK